MKKYILNLAHSCCNEGHNVEIEVIEFTKRMQMRIVKATPDEGDDDDEDQFECGIDIFRLHNNRPIVTTNLGVYGPDFADFVTNYLRLKPTHDVKGVIKKVVFCDDTDLGCEYDPDTDTFYHTREPEYLDDDCIKILTKYLTVVE